VDPVTLAILVLLPVVAGLVALVANRGRRSGTLPPRSDELLRQQEPGVGDDAEVPRDTATRTVEEVDLPTLPSQPTAPTYET